MCGDVLDQLNEGQVDHRNLEGEIVVSDASERLGESRPFIYEGYERGFKNSQRVCNHRAERDKPFRLLYGTRFCAVRQVERGHQHFEPGQSRENGDRDGIHSARRTLAAISPRRSNVARSISMCSTREMACVQPCKK